MWRPRGIALVALVALVLLRGLGLAADAWTANQIECCCGRHAVDHDCGSNLCPSHLRGRGAAHDDRRSHLRACGHHAPLHDVGASPTIALAAPAIPRPSPRPIAAPDRPLAAPPSRVVRSETPPS